MFLYEIWNWIVSVRVAENKDETTFCRLFVSGISLAIVCKTNIVHLGILFPISLIVSDHFLEAVERLRVRMASNTLN